MNRIGVALVLGAAVIAAGCQSAFGPTVRRTAGVEGNWVDTNGVGLSSFNGGAFTTVAADTGNKLSEGSYRTPMGARSRSPFAQSSAIPLTAQTAPW